MSQKDDISIGRMDWLTILIYLVMVLLGWMSIYAAGYSDEHTNIFDMDMSYGRQMVWIITAFVLALFVLIIDVRFYSRFSNGLYIGIIVLLLFVLVYGSVISGSKSWLDIGNGVRIQPSEFAKFITALAVAKILSKPGTSFTENKLLRRDAYLIVLAPALLTLLQRDTGSAIVFGAFILVFYREGISGMVLLFLVWVIGLFFLSLLIKQLVLMSVLLLITALLIYMARDNRKEIIKVISVFAFSIVFILSVNYIFDQVLLPHQKDRVNVMIGKDYDPKGSAYNVNQSLIAIGSGGLSGKGFLQGTQTKYNFVPEQSTDFIYCTIGEEWGFLGSTFVLALFVLLMGRIIFIAERQRSDFSRIYAYAVASIFFIHFLINIGMTLALVPVIGIPLPFFSYGGSSLWAFTLMLFILIKLDMHRNQLV